MLCTINAGLVKFSIYTQTIASVAMDNQETSESLDYDLLAVMGRNVYVQRFESESLFIWS